jgi:hypothetical protein
VIDAITVLHYVETAATAAQSVQLFSKDSLDPAYPGEDSFPRPDVSSGIKRYDLRRPALPTPGSQGSAGVSATATTRNFRKMAIYVKNRRVFRVLERVEVVGTKSTDALLGYIRASLREAKAGEAVRQQFEAAIKPVPSEQLGAALLFGLNQVLIAQGQSPVPARIMELNFRDVGDPHVSVDLPSDQVVHGSLALLLTAGGRSKLQTSGGATPTGTSATTPSTSVTGGGSPSG